jgi:hypothetical protein
MGSGLAAMGLAPSAVGTGKPDLVVTQATKVGPVYAFKGRSATLGFKDVTKNKGTATALASRTGMLLVPKNTRTHVSPVKLASRVVPKLRPGHSDRGAASDSVDTEILPLGAYKVKVCADMNHRQRERREGNNCERVGNFYVVKHAWTGPMPTTNAVDGVGGAGSAAGAEKWHSPDGFLIFAKYLGGGIFRYDFVGHVKWKDSGVTTGGCDVSGQGEKFFQSAPGIKLDYFAGTYEGKLVTDRFYTITFTPQPGSPFCDGSTAPGPATREFLNIEPRDLLFDQNELKGSFSTGGAEGATTWRWDF